MIKEQGGIIKQTSTSQPNRCGICGGPILTASIWTAERGYVHINEKDCLKQKYKVLDEDDGYCD